MIEQTGIPHTNMQTNVQGEQSLTKREQESENALNQNIQAFQIGNQCCAKTQIKLKAALIIRDKLLSSLKKLCNHLYFPNPNSKLVKSSILRLFNYSYKNQIKTAFLKIRNTTPLIQSTVSLPNRHQRSLVNYQSFLPLYQDQTKAQQLISFIQSDIQSLKNNYFQNKNERRTLELELTNKNLKKQLSNMKQQIEFYKQRQERQNEKKKQSLLMLAQELGQKNEVIQDLKKSLKFYQDKYETSENILDDDLASSKKEIQNLQGVRKRLQADLQKYKQKFENAEQLLKQSLDKIKHLLQGEENIQQLKREYQIKIQKLDKMKTTYSQLIQKIQRQNKRLNTYMHKIQNNHIKTKDAQQAKDCINQLKIQLMLKFISHISENYDLQFDTFSLLGQEELQILSKLKIQWMELQKQAKIGHKIDHIKQSDISGILMKGPNGNLDTLFNVLDSPNQVTTHNNVKGPTMKILQLQLQINKQVQKISELKNKIMHIRVIILNLLKALQIQQNPKPEALAVLQLIFELFQYSEEERQSIFVKKKKIFGLI